MIFMSLIDRLKNRNSEPKRWKQRPEVLLHPQIPAPLHGMAPREVLGHDWWTRTSQEAYASTDWHCVACGTFKNDIDTYKYLEAHEMYEIDYKRGTMTYVETVPLCKWCHQFIHFGRIMMLLQDNKISRQEAQEISRRGRAILEKFGIKQKPMPPSLGRAWDEWRLVIGD